MLLCEPCLPVQMRSREDGSNTASMQVARSILTSDKGREHYDLFGHEVESMSQGAFISMYLLQRNNEGIVIGDLS